MLPFNFVVLGLGSNRPSMEFGCVELLQKAISRLSSMFYTFKVSSVFRTKPMYVENQSDFHNMVLCGFLCDSISPSELLQNIHLIEADLGRFRPSEIRNGPRSMDIDIELFGSEIVNLPDLIIPHPRIKERSFVLCPLLDVLRENFDDNIKYECLKFIGVNSEEISEYGVEKIISSDEFMKGVEPVVNR